MSTFEDQFENHGVHSVLDQLEAAVNQESEHEIDESTLDNIDRLKQATKFIATRLQQSSPVLNPISKLNNIQKQLQGALNETNAFNSNRNAAHLANASNQIDGKEERGQAHSPF